MNFFKHTLLFFLSLALFACDKKPNNNTEDQEKYIELGEQVRDLSCPTSKEFKKCFEEYLDTELTHEEASSLEAVFDTYFILFRKDQVTMDEAILGVKLQLNELLFKIKIEDEDLSPPNLYKLSRLSELEKIIIQIIES
jgi:hypothetical protein